LNFPIKIKKLSTSDSQFFEQVKTIYLNSFPASERQEPSVFTDRFLSGESIFFVILSKENQVLAMCSLFDLHTHDFVLLDYLAVEESNRDKGLGAILFQAIKEWAFKNFKKIIIEVENPLYGEDRLDKERRISFYERQGAQLLTGVRYLLPPLDGKTIEEMNLMIVAKIKDEKFSNKIVFELIEQIYQRVYRRSKNDALLTEIKKGLTSEIIN